MHVIVPENTLISHLLPKMWGIRYKFSENTRTAKLQAQTRVIILTNKRAYLCARTIFGYYYVVPSFSHPRRRGCRGAQPPSLASVKLDSPLEHIHPRHNAWCKWGV